jgi:hypothetical protein
MKDNQIYYFEVGRGQWRGKYYFVIDSWKGFRKSPMPFKYKLLVIMMHFVSKIFGHSAIRSLITATPEMQEKGVANNNYRVSKFGITLFFSNEDYLLDANGSDVMVKPNERFGPIPFLFREHDPYRAVIHDQGISSTYYIILLSDHWIGQYQVSPDKRHVVGILKNGWATVTELLDKQ